VKSKNINEVSMAQLIQSAVISRQSSVDSQQSTVNSRQSTVGSQQSTVRMPEPIA